MKTNSLASMLGVLRGLRAASTAARPRRTTIRRRATASRRVRLPAARQVRDAHRALIDIGWPRRGVPRHRPVVPLMGWHYTKDALVDGGRDPTKPSCSCYADDPCGGKRKLVAVEYAVPFAESKRAPLGFVGRADNGHELDAFHAGRARTGFGAAAMYSAMVVGVTRSSPSKCAFLRGSDAATRRQPKRAPCVALPPAPARATPDLPRAAPRES